MTNFDFKTVVPETTIIGTNLLLGASSDAASTPTVYTAQAILDAVDDNLPRTTLAANTAFYLRTLPSTVTISVATPAVVSWATHGLSIGDPVVFSQPKNFASCTVTSANPGVVTRNSHGFAAGDPIEFHTTGVLPTAIVFRKTYYVLATSLTSNTFRFSLTPGGAAVDTTTGSPSGTHYVRRAENILIGVVTMTSANPGVFTCASHGLVVNTAIIFTTTGALPTNINTGGIEHQVYYVLSSGLTANNFQVSDSPGGTAINTTAGTPSGTASVWRLNGLPTGVDAGIIYYVIAAGFGANAFEFSQTAGGSAINTTGTVVGIISAQTGNDSNSGSAATRSAAMLTMQGVYDKLSKEYDFDNYDVTVNIAGGQYGISCYNVADPGLSGVVMDMTNPWLGGGSITWTCPATSSSTTSAQEACFHTPPQYSDIFFIGTVSLGPLTFINPWFLNPTFSCINFNATNAQTVINSAVWDGGATDDPYLISQTRDRVQCTGTHYVFGGDIVQLSFATTVYSGSLTSCFATFNVLDQPNFTTGFFNANIQGAATTLVVFNGTSTGPKAYIDTGGSVTEARGLGRTAIPGVGITFAGEGHYSYTDHDNHSNDFSQSIAIGLKCLFSQLPSVVPTGAIGTITDGLTATRGSIAAGGGSLKLSIFYDGTNWRVLGNSQSDANDHIAPIQAQFDGGGSVLTVATVRYQYVPYACTITGWTIWADQIGSAVVDVWLDSYANFPPTVADTIAASAKPTLSSANHNQNTSLVGWTTAVPAGSFIGFNIDSVTTCTFVGVTLQVTKT